MTETPMVQEVDCITGEEILRPATETEIAAMEAFNVATEERIAAEEAEAERIAALKASAIAKLTSGQALTEDEAKTIVL